MKKIFFLIVIILPLTSCSNKNSNFKNELFIRDTNSFNVLINQFANNIETIWGQNEILIAGPKDYIKHTDQYKTRSHINFDTGIITIETISTKNPYTILYKTIINTLLMNNDSDTINFYSDVNKITNNKEPFLYGQILDNNQKPIRWSKQAAIFANYLLQNKLQIRFSGKRKIWSITIRLVPNHINKRSNKYLKIVRKASKLYGVDQSLILAIIQTESSFNPYAISNSYALGLMQVVQHSAGRDVFKVKKKYGEPSKSYLLNPKNNIDIGTAYLSILQDNYLSAIINPLSKRYAVIMAYNCGASSVLKVFSQNPNQAFKKINNMHSDEVYRTLYFQHPSTESRNYLYKVNNLQKKYQL